MTKRDRNGVAEQVYTTSPTHKKRRMSSAVNKDIQNGSVVNIDEDLHSRQLAVYGKESMRKMANANILICGLKGVGVEIAKNVVLAGVKSVILLDNGVVKHTDLASQFYLQQEDVGKKRAEACVAKVQQLNTAVKVYKLATKFRDKIYKVLLYQNQGPGQIFRIGGGASLTASGQRARRAIVLQKDIYLL
eukprot:TRINITY_DN4529_c0_g2_i3.p1 TRINITY_DN4529_c0_g2~~TRINITY_DN4529_c0_g2_i3.p1  ORF type:complete len:190 (-),score=25.36 TRINITY_DN4529_c0_g2_i3:233-802(-)